MRVFTQHTVDLLKSGGVIRGFKYTVYQDWDNLTAKRFTNLDAAKFYATGLVAYLQLDRQPVTYRVTV